MVGRGEDGGLMPRQKSGKLKKGRAVRQWA